MLVKEGVSDQKEYQTAVTAAVAVDFGVQVMNELVGKSIAATREQNAELMAAAVFSALKIK